MEATAYSGRLALKATVACAAALSRQPVEALTGRHRRAGVQLRTRELTASGPSPPETARRCSGRVRLAGGTAGAETLYAVAQPQLNGVSGGMSRAG